MSFAFAAVEVFASVFILGLGRFLLGSVDEHLLEPRMLLEQFLEGANLPSPPALPFATTTTTTAAAAAAASF
jgi:hypothetical protein